MNAQSTAHRRENLCGTYQTHCVNAIDDGRPGSVSYDMGARRGSSWPPRGEACDSQRGAASSSRARGGRSVSPLPPGIWTARTAPGTAGFTVFRGGRDIARRCWSLRGQAQVQGSLRCADVSFARPILIYHMCSFLDGQRSFSVIELVPCCKNWRSNDIHWVV